MEGARQLCAVASKAASLPPSLGSSWPSFGGSPQAPLALSLEVACRNHRLLSQKLLGLHRPAWRSLCCKNILLCLCVNSQIGSVGFVFFFQSGGHHTLGAAPTCFPPKGSSPQQSGLCSLTQPRRTQKRASDWQVPREEQQRALRRELAGGWKAGCGQATSEPTSLHPSIRWAPPHPPASLRRGTGSGYRSLAGRGILAAPDASQP